MADMPIVRERGDNAKLGCVLSNSFGFGGTNASVVFKRLDVHRIAMTRTDAGQARPGHGGRQRPFDRLGHRQDAGRARRRARLHLSGRGARPARQAARRVGRRASSCCRATSRTSPRSMRCSPRSKKQWGTMDFLVHAIGFSDKNELKGRYADTTRENFQRTMVISCFSFTEAAKRAARADAERRRDGDADLQRRRPRHAELQRDGRRQGGAGSVGALSRGRFRAAEDPRQRDLGRARSARSPAPASTTRATCSRSSSSIRRSAAA